LNVVTEVYQKEDKTIIYQYNETDKFMIRGNKMYVKGFEELVIELTKNELLAFLKIYSDDNNVKEITKANILKKPFKYYTKQLTDSQRSKLKKKLFEIGAIAEYNKKIMINPFILLPRNDKNIKNFQHLVQRTWIYLFKDKDKWFNGINDFISEIF